MGLELGGVLGRFRNPDYTGNNRCIPCTLLNLYVAALVGFTIALAQHQLVGATVFAVLALLVYFRGYLVPGIPALTAVPKIVLSRVRRSENRDETESESEGESEVKSREGSQTKAGSGTEEQESTSFVMELIAVDVLERQGEQLDLTRSAHTDWWNRIRTLDQRDSVLEPLARQYGLDPDRASLDWVGESPVLSDDGRALEVWPSEAALVADVAMELVLADRVDWHQFDRAERNLHLEMFRRFLEACPNCGTALQSPSGSGHRADDAGTDRNAALSIECRDCGATILEKR
ncbi:hypothetical protein AArcSl_2779 [Halalkaliarchaeum desulfuricum]|uniref:Uncharacterized protein n=1 Tax=Halalkaliarchaeum desulfuricum TaxID=2055893 RepID=A0A343TMS2_9EURY|nr:hypothetical protein [Halalkaliarchaeum desulfuricum]AUX10394.1 hypothetical protein AArcSl_2779 [Halalkaliarchaeum desulfuricum]